MRNEENNLLAKWLEGSINESETEYLSAEVDIESLNYNLEKLNKLVLNSKPIDKSWHSFLKRIKREEIATEPAQDRPLSLSERFSYAKV